MGNWSMNDLTTRSNFSKDFGYMSTAETLHSCGHPNPGYTIYDACGAFINWHSLNILLLLFAVWRSKRLH